MDLSYTRSTIERMFDTVDEAALIDRIAVLERAKSAAAAEQAVLTAQLDTTRRAREAAAGVPAARRGKGLCSEIAMARRDGPTSALNGLGECAHCNYTKEAPGWSVTTSYETGCHTAEFTMPAGARHRSVAPRMPGRQMTMALYSALDVRLALALSEHAA